MGKPSRSNAIRASNVRRDYTPLAPHYEARWHEFNAAAREWVLAHWPTGLESGARVLDLGCGTGGFLAALSERHPGTELFGLDITPAMLAEARRAAPSVALIEADVERPPVRPGAFCVVCSLNILHHLNEPAAHIPAMADLCRPGGTLFLSTFAGARPAIDPLLDLWLRWRNPAWRGMTGPKRLMRLLEAEQRLVIVAHDTLRAGPVWQLQLYQLARKQN